MLKIVVELAENTAALKAEGCLIGPWVEELRQSCSKALDRARSLTLDLAGVLFMDGAGIALVQDLKRRQVQVANCSPFVTEQLWGASAVACDGREEDGEHGLLERLRAGKADALDALMTRYGARIYRLARGITRNDADAEEVVQDVFFTLVRKHDTFEGRAALGSWIYRIATNLALNKRRGKRFTMEMPLEDCLPKFKDDGHRDGDTSFLLADWSQSPEHEVLSAESRRVINEMLDRLPDHYRAILILRDVEERSNEEVAEILGETIAAVKSKLHRARMALREQLTRHLAPQTVTAR
jgi:RNA polymerase sigma-70 factor (ECF subfamily)